MDTAHVRRHAEEYVAESLRIMERSGAVTVSDQKRQQMVEATMRVTGIGVKSVIGKTPTD